MRGGGGLWMGRVMSAACIAGAAIEVDIARSGILGE